MNHELLEVFKSNAQFKYHAKSCYSTFLKKANRFKPPASLNEDINVNTEPTSELQKPKRRKLSREKVSTSVRPEDKPCIICNCMKKHNVQLRYRISTKSRAVVFINAYKLNLDDVFSRCSVFNDPEDIFAADIMYHKNCMSHYLSQYHRRVSMVIDNLEAEDQSCDNDVQIPV